MSEPDDPWLAAVERMYEFRDVKPLAAMVHSSEPMPHWVRNQLAHLLDNSAGYSVGEDRLAFVRTDRMRAKISTQNNRFDVGMIVLTEIEKGASYEEALRKAAGKKANKKRGYDFSYEEKAYRAVKMLPPQLRPGVRKSPQSRT